MSLLLRCLNLLYLDIPCLDVTAGVISSLEDVDQLVEEEGGRGDGDPLPGVDATVHPDSSGVCTSGRSSNLHHQDLSSFMAPAKFIFDNSIYNLSKIQTFPW